MPLLKTGFICLLLFVCAARAAAQPHLRTKEGTFKKPELFRDLPTRMKVTVQTLAPLLQKEVGERVTISLSPDFLFSGVVVSRSSAAETRYKTVVLKSTNRRGATFTITALRNSDGRYRYNAQLLSMKHSDAYELVETKGAFALQKTEAAELVSE